MSLMSSENYLLHGKYPEGYTKGKKSKSAYFTVHYYILLSYCFVLLKLVKVYILAIKIEQ